MPRLFRPSTAFSVTAWLEITATASASKSLASFKVSLSKSGLPYLQVSNCMRFVSTRTHYETHRIHRRKPCREHTAESDRRTRHRKSLGHWGAPEQADRNTGAILRTPLVGIPRTQSLVGGFSIILEVQSPARETITENSSPSGSGMAAKLCHSLRGE